MPRSERDLCDVDNATAKRLLKAYLPVVYALAPLFSALDAASLRAAGEDAILEAFITLDPERAQESTWVRRVIHWRLAEASQLPWDHNIARFDSDPQAPNGIDPEEAFWRATCVSALGHLTTRQQMVVEGRMKGLTFEELGIQLGISHTVVHRESLRAFAALRDLLSDNGVD